MNQKTKRMAIAFLPMGIMFALIIVGVLTFSGDARFYPAAIYLGGVVLWGLWYKNEKQNDRLVKVKALHQDTNSNPLSLLDIAMESYNSAPDSLKTREMLRLAYQRLKEKESRLTVVEPDTTGVQQARSECGAG